MNNDTKVLFIGNSHTYYNDMPYMLRCLSCFNKELKPVEPVILVHPYKTLEKHKVEPEVRFNILYGEYDYVVLQQGAHPFLWEEVLIRDALVAPVGIIIEMLRKLARNIELFDKHGEHASKIGSYLVACTFYSVIYGHLYLMLRYS